MLQATATGKEAILLAKLIPQIMKEHARMEAAWQVFYWQLQSIASGESSGPPEKNVKHFMEIDSAHMGKEETHLAPMAKRLFSEQQMAQPGNAMRVRRGLPQ